MRELYNRLSRIGLHEKYVRRVLLPDWWDDEAAETPGGYTQALWTIARHSGLEVERLEDTSASLQVPCPRPVQFRNTRGASPEDVALAGVLAEQAALYALLGTSTGEKTLPASASEIRSQILSGNLWVALESLLDYCWSSGIPVLHVSQLPGGRKMDALATSIEGRHAIVIALSNKHPAWHLFPLAHEIGHIALGHLARDGTIVDTRVDRDSEEPQEVEANRFAIKLLTGSEDTQLAPTGALPKAKKLARDAQEFGKKNRIDPGHAVLNYAHTMTKYGAGQFWGVANLALKELPAPDATETIRRKMAENLDPSKMPSEAFEFVSRITGLETGSVS